MKPLSPRVQNFYTQTGIQNELLIMWKYDMGNHIQKAYKIDVFCDDLPIYSTGKILSDKQNGICLNPDLQEQTKYGFSVSVWDENDIMEQSDRVSFITGVNNWIGNWIGNRSIKPFIARKRFYCGKRSSAILSVGVPGQFEVKINGRKVSPYVYEGSQTDFNKHIHYYTYDVAEFVVEGKNEITIEVANGWYIGDSDNGKRHFYTMNMGYQPFGNCLAVIAQMKIDGQYIFTDDTWMISASQTVLADIYGSEDIDKTIMYKWEPAEILGNDAPTGILIPCNYPPVIRKYCYEPVCVDRKRMIFDFGQNMSSQFFLRIRGRNRQRVKLLPAEKLSEDGNIIQTTNTYSMLTLSGNEDVIEQKFSVNGARWYQIEGAEYEQVIEFKSYFVTSSASDCGCFQCSDEHLNKIYMLILKAIESNINHLHTDCPTIEKLGWLEPNHLMAHSIMFNKEVDTLWSKIAMDMRDAQYGEQEYDTDKGIIPHKYEKGLIPSIAPRYARFINGTQEGSFWDIVPWGSSIILAAYEQYRFYGNRQVLEDNYESAKQYIEYLTVQYNSYNQIYNKSGKEYFICTGLGDWGYEQNKGRSRENVETAFYYHDLITMAGISRILEKKDTDYFIMQADRVEKQYNYSLLVTENGKTYYRAYDTGEITQANQAIPLCFGLVPQDKVADVQHTMIGLCEGKHLECGEIGLVYILRALSAANRNDIIYNMALKDTHPSYIRFVEMGETTLPEFWRDDARSRNHDMMGHIMEWFFEEIAGIKSDDGFETVRIKPACMDLVDSFECVYESIRGKIKVKYMNGKLSVTVPNNTAWINDANAGI